MRVCSQADVRSILLIHILLHSQFGTLISPALAKGPRRQPKSPKIQPRKPKKLRLVSVAAVIHSGEYSDKPADWSGDEAAKDPAPAPSKGKAKESNARSKRCTCHSHVQMLILICLPCQTEYAAPTIIDSDSDAEPEPAVNPGKSSLRFEGSTFDTFP